MIGLVAASTLTPAGADNPVVVPIVDQGVAVELTPYVEIPDSTRGRARINNFATTGDRLFVVEDFDGKIYEVSRTTTGGEAELFFDVRAALLAATGRQINNESTGHGGLRSVAFHPNFATNGFFYTSLMETRPANSVASEYLSDVANPIVADGVLIEWQVDLTTGQVDPGSYRQLFRVGMPVFDHPIKQISFNPFAEPGDPDFGNLYIAHGDGSVQSASSGGGFNNDALGKILRINPRARLGQPYTVPDDNPFVGDVSMLDEVWSLGHRNPHHMAFGEDASGDVHLIVAEPGRNNVEEVNLIVAGANYGWSDREGTFVHRASGGLINGVSALPADEAENGFTYPAAQYGHDGPAGSTFSSQAVAGGYVIDNGSELDGQYFYSDFPSSGALYQSSFDDLLAAVTLLDPDDPARDSPDDLSQAPTGRVSILFDHDSDPSTAALERSSLADVFNDAPRYDQSGRADVRFGQGIDGELYISSKRNGLIYLVTNSVPSVRMCQGQLATTRGLAGTAGGDVIVGTGGRDVIDGGAGDDVICGRGGADEIVGGSGNDIINAGWGGDVVRAGDGNDLVFGGPGLDNIEGGSGSDVLRGGRGGDRLVGNGGNDMIYGGARKDRLFGFSGDDQLFGGAGQDNLRGGAGTDTAVGGDGVDLCVSAESTTGCE